MKVKLKKRKISLRRKWFVFLIIILLISFFIYKGNTTVGVTYFDIYSEEIPSAFDNYTIVQLSDLHDAEIGDDHLEVVHKVKLISPNAIFITGDFIDSNRYNLERSLTLIDELQFVAPIYYVTGNHEIATKDSKRIKASLVERGVRVLTNEADIVKIDTFNSIAIGGIEDPLGSKLEDDEAVKNSISHAFTDVPKSMFKILLSHRPEQFNVYVEEGIDVTFSGHAHGGQFRIPGIGGLVSPGQGWFPKYSSGTHEKNGSQLVVSRGLGNSVIPVRLFNQPEIVVVTLQKVK